MIFLPLDEDVTDRLVAKYGYIKVIMPECKYKEVPENYLTVADAVMLICNDNVSEELAYQLTKILCENGETWKDTHSMFKNFNPSECAQVPIPLHPGAKRYYQEKGYLK
ncbi:hypothetical protein ES708_16519 [subsurface metagenome]